MGAALKLRIEYEWVIPDENIPVFTLFTEGATYHSVSLNSSFQWRKRKLTAVCSHQTRIGNLDAHLI
ncbi:hypothetical protein ELY24_26910 [Escherichia coli]|nr:hypothetical protein BE932_06740 [Escherichia coli]TLH07741.1 hypothetical protein EWT55_26840 [Escherichia coli O25b:H4]TNA44074.1 hypothetical protein EMF73_26685 [Klebsiella pneumoniae]KAA1862355.1 hypothetical protein EA188_28350 [Escherichia coli]KAA1877710.1 hypothetical protein EA191_28240 [Escherichia coli]